MRFCLGVLLLLPILFSSEPLQGQGLSPATPAKEYIYVGGKLVSVDAPAAAPSAPSGLVATAMSSSQINLAWTDNSNNETGFKIERKTGAGGTYAQIDTVGANVTSYPNTGLNASTTYFYRVRANNGGGDSPYSNEASATTFTPSAPAPPSNLGATVISGTQITLTWTDNSGNETGFKIERKLGQGGTYAQIATVGVNVTSYPDSGLTIGAVYYYRVRAYNGVGNSAYSNEVNACTGTLSGAGGYDGQSANIVYTGTGWSNDSSFYPLAYNGSLKYSEAAQDKATFSFSGDNITWIFTKDVFRGKAAIKIDGVSKTNLDLYSPYRLWQVSKTYSGLGTGNHTIEITVLHQKTAAAASYHVDVDGFVVGITPVGSGTYDDTHTQFKYIGNWNHESVYPQAYNSTISWSQIGETVTEEAVTFTFTGTQLTYFYTKAFNRGIAQITIDGVSKGTIDMYSATVIWQASTVFSSLGSGIHTVHIAVTRQKNAASTDLVVDVDKLVLP